MATSNNASNFGGRGYVNASENGNACEPTSTRAKYRPRISREGLRIAVTPPKAAVAHETLRELNQQLPVPKMETYR